MSTSSSTTHLTVNTEAGNNKSENPGDKIDTTEKTKASLIDPMDQTEIQRLQGLMDTIWKKRIEHGLDPRNERWKELAGQCDRLREKHERLPDTPELRARRERMHEKLNLIQKNCTCSVVWLALTAYEELEAYAKASTKASENTHSPGLEATLAQRQRMPLDLIGSLMFSPFCRIGPCTKKQADLLTRPLDPKTNAVALSKLEWLTDAEKKDLLEVLDCHHQHESLRRQRDHFYRAWTFVSLEQTTLPAMLCI